MSDQTPVTMPRPAPDAPPADAATTPVPDEPIVYRYADADKPEGERRYFGDAPQKHLTAHDVARMPASILKRITGGADPIYVKVKRGEAKAASTAAESKKE